MSLQHRLEAIREDYNKAGVITKKTGGKHIEQILEFLGVMRFELEETQEKLRKLEQRQADTTKQIEQLAAECKETNQLPRWILDRIQQIARG